MSKEIQIDSSDLSNKGYSNLAILAGDNKITAEELAEVPAAVEDMQKLLEKVKANKDYLQGITENQLSELLAEAKKTASAAPAAAASATPEKKNSAETNNIQSNAQKARTAVEKAFPKNEEYLSALQRVLAKVPMMEPSSVSDIRDAVHQSRTFNLQFIDWLEAQSKINSSSLDTSWKEAGRFPFWFNKTTFDNPKHKRRVINEMLAELSRVMEDPNIQAGMIESSLSWVLEKGAGTVYFAVTAILVFQGGKWVLNHALGAPGRALSSAIGMVGSKAWELGKWSIWLGQKGVSKAADKLKERSEAKAATEAAAEANKPVPTQAEIDAEKTKLKARENAVLEAMYTQLNSPTESFEEFKKKALNNIGSAENIEYRLRLAEVTEIHDKLVIAGPKDSGRLRVALNRAIAGGHPDGFFERAKEGLKSYLTFPKPDHWNELGLNILPEGDADKIVQKMFSEAKVNATEIKEARSLTETTKEKIGGATTPKDAMNAAKIPDDAKLTTAQKTEITTARNEHIVELVKKGIGAATDVQGVIDTYNSIPKEAEFSRLRTSLKSARNQKIQTIVLDEIEWATSENKAKKAWEKVPQEIRDTMTGAEINRIETKVTNRAQQLFHSASKKISAAESLSEAKAAYLKAIEEFDPVRSAELDRTFEEKSQKLFDKEEAAKREKLQTEVEKREFDKASETRRQTHDLAMEKVKQEWAVKVAQATGPANAAGTTPGGVREGAVNVNVTVWADANAQVSKGNGTNSNRRGGNGDAPTPRPSSGPTGNPPRSPRGSGGNSPVATDRQVATTPGGRAEAQASARIDTLNSAERTRIISNIESDLADLRSPETTETTAREIRSRISQNLERLGYEMSQTLSPKQFIRMTESHLNTARNTTTSVTPTEVQSGERRAVREWSGARARAVR